MLPKKKRLTTAEFSRFFRSGTRFHSPNLQLIYTPHDEFRGAVVVGKKVAKNAVDRNALRRRIYALLSQEYADDGLAGVFILIAKPSARTAATETLRAEVVTLVGRTRK